MILTKRVIVNINPKNINYYRLLGFDNIRIKDKLEIDVKLLSKNSRTIIDCKCINCSSIKNIKYVDYNKITSNGINDYYCKNCKSIKTKQTNLKKYGVENVFQMKEIKEKIKKTNLKKYGVEHHTKTNDYIEKTKKTNLEKYGVEFVQQNESIRKKTEKTSIITYGYKTSLLNENIKEKSNKTLINKYGTIYPLQNKYIKNKFILTRKKNILNKYNDLDILDMNSDLYTIKCDNGLNHTFEISSTLLYHRKIKYKTIVCTICNKINSKNISGLQLEFFNFIENNYNQKIIQNDRDIINPHELDIYLPDINLSFEFNGVYWHNELYKDKKYHNKKTELCLEKGIQLIHVYEDDWVYKKDIVKSMILNKLGKTENKIYGRKTTIKEISNNKLIREFLEKNHIQGFVGSSIKLGLFYKNELVSLMTFGKLRKPLNLSSKNDEYEMLRFCNKLNTNIIGGASKLFKYFIKNYNPLQIISYADRSYSNGNLYKQLKFELDKITEPNYFYIINGIKHYRFNFRKDILVKQGFDKNKTEHEIMLERKYYRLYNSGNYKFVYKKRSYK